MSAIVIHSIMGYKSIVVEAEGRASRIDLEGVESISRLPNDAITTNDAEYIESVNKSRSIYIHLKEEDGHVITADTEGEARALYRQLLDLWYTAVRVIGERTDADKSAK